MAVLTAGFSRRFSSPKVLETTFAEIRIGRSGMSMGPGRMKHMNSIPAFETALTETAPVEALSPGSFGGAGGFGMPSAWARRAEAQTDELLSLLEDNRRQAAAIEAQQVVILDALRVHSEQTQSLHPDPATTHRWTERAVARRTLVSEVAASLRLPERTAERIIEESRMLVHQLPATLTALHAGQISRRHATILIDHASSLPAETLPAFETAALPYAHTLTPSKFDRKARIVRERTRPDSIHPRTVTATENRSVNLDPARDGMCYLVAYLPAQQGLAIINRLTDIARTECGPDESRSLAQLKADILAGLLIDGVVDHSYVDESMVYGCIIDERGMLVTPIFREGFGRGIIAKVMITVPVLTLLGHTQPGQDSEPVMLDGYGPIDLATAKKLTADAPSMIRLLTDPHTGIVLGVGKSRQIPKELRRWLQVRDKTCRFVGCNQPARVCDLDHTIDAQCGGLSEESNLAALCPKHHDSKHHTDWTMTQHPGGDITWVSPSGREYTTRPAMRLAATRIQAG